MSAYDSFANYYDDFKLGDDYDLLYNALASIRDFSEIAKPIHTIWDFGTGTGAIADRFAKHGYDVYGSDSSERMLEIARAKNRQVHFVHSDIREEPEISQQVDLAVAIDDILNSLDRDELETGIQNILRQVKNGGYFQFDLVPLSTFQRYLRDVTFRQINNSYFLCRPGHPVDTSYYGPFIYIINAISFSPKTKMWTDTVCNIVEYFHDETFVENLLSKAGATLVDKSLLLSDGRVINAESDIEPNVISKILYLYRKEVDYDARRD